MFGAPPVWPVDHPTNFPATWKALGVVSFPLTQSLEPIISSRHTSSCPVVRKMDKVEENPSSSRSAGRRGDKGDVQRELRRKKPSFVPLFPDFREGNFSTREAMLRFNQVFRARYPSSSLDFFVGELSEAVTEAFHATVGPGEMERKRLLALYLHDDNLDRAIAAHIFPEKVLSDELVLSVLGENYLPWAWDLTVEGSSDLLKEQMAAAGLTAVWEAVNQLPRDAYPLLVVVREPDRVVYAA